VLTLQLARQRNHATEENKERAEFGFGSGWNKRVQMNSSTETSKKPNTTAHHWTRDSKAVALEGLEAP